MNDPVGSTWRRWDLHFHSPRSFDYRGGQPSASDIVKKLRDSDVAVVAVTDHHLLDVQLIQDMREAAEGRLLVLPGIELRSEYGGAPVHYIGLFPEDIDLADLWDTLKGGLGLTPSHLGKKGGDEKIYVKLADAHALMVDELGGLISIHAGAKSNSIEEIRNSTQFQQRMKLDITRDYVHLLEVGQLKEVLSYVDTVYPATGLNHPLIIGSDNHAIESYTPPPCWIKADPTFVGLRQVLNEPTERVHLGNLPPQLAARQEEPTRFIETIRLWRDPTADTSQVWFDEVEVSLNQGLVAVIGNQGSGKSALTDVLGLLGNCPHQESFAFLNEDQFLNPKTGKGADFHAELRWADGETVERRLDASVVSGARETIKYIPQFHLDEICDELKGGQGGRFEDELKAVVFSRIPQEETARRETLDALIDFRTRDARGRIERLRSDVRVASEEYEALEARSLPSHRTALEEQLARLQQQIRAHRETKPAEVPEPRTDEGDEQSALRVELDVLAAETEDLDTRIQAARKDLTKINEDLEDLKQVRASISGLKDEVDRTREKLSDEFAKLRLSFDEVVSFSIDATSLDQANADLVSKRTGLVQSLDADSETSLLGVKQVKVDRRRDVQDALTRPQKEYAEYKEAMRSWEERLSALVGDEDSPDTEVYVQGKTAALSDVPVALEASRGKLRKLAEEILEAKASVLEVSEELHQPVRDFIASHPIAGDQFGLDFFVSFVPRDFITRFLDYLNQGRRGSFYGEEDGRKRVSRTLKKSDFSDATGALDFLDQIMGALTLDARPGGEKTFVTDQLRQDFSTSDLLTYLFGLSYLEPQFELLWHGRPLDQLSPGERGTLLLIFFLLVDDAQTPLVIDQPEGNLDNQTVFELLVDCIKDAKKRRQIVIVTHNPNLAVVCDAEQVILASLDKSDAHRVRYKSGALENPQVGNRLVDILEGTRPAIENRMAKYRIIFD